MSRIDNAAIARNVLADLTKHGVEPTPAVNDAVANHARLVKERPRKEVRTFEGEAARALAAGDNAKADQLLHEAVLRPGRGQAYGLAITIADNKIIAAVNAAAARFAEALRGPAEVAITRINAGAPLWQADVDQLLGRGRTSDAQLVVDARGAEVELAAIYKLRDQLLDLSGAAVHKPWRRNFEAAGQWIAHDSRGESRLLPGHPATGASLLQSVATGGVLTYAATKEAVAQATAAIEADLAASEAEPRRQAGGVAVVR